MQPDSFTTYFKLRNGPQLLKNAAIAGAVCMFVAVALFKSGMEPMKVGYILIGAVVIAGLLFLLVLVIPSGDYRKFVNGKSPLAEGWKKFLSRRSEDFMSGKNYSFISVTIQPTALATTEHHEKVKAFLASWQAESAHLFGGKFVGPRPDNLTVKGFVIEGHVLIGTSTNIFLDRISRQMDELMTSINSNARLSLTFRNEGKFEPEGYTPDINDEMRERERDRKWMEN